MNTIRLAILIIVLGALGDSAVYAQQTSDRERPFVQGGIYDKPYLTSLKGRAHLGGYLETNFRFERTDGFKEELTFKVQRFNLFVFAPVSERLRIAAEIEFEEGAEEIVLELVTIDFEIHPSLIFRSGILLSPLGRFNLSHDSPANALTDRPLVSTQIIPTTLSEPGMGFYGTFNPSLKSRITYEAYLVNGFNAGVVGGSPDGVRITAGKANLEDNNSYPSFVGRIGISPVVEFELGVSAHTGPYNVWTIEGLDIDQRRDVSIFALDAEANLQGINFQGEYAHASIDVPPQLGGVFANSQNGFYLQLKRDFLKSWIIELPDSYFAAVTRYEVVDFDSDINGDDQKRLTLGLNFRPTAETVFKADYQHNWMRDRFNNESRSAAINFGVATYF